MLCGEMPCVCGKPAPASKKVKVKAKPKPEAEPAVQVDESEPVVLRKPRASVMHLIQQEAEEAPDMTLPRLEVKRKGKVQRSAEVGETRTEDEVVFSAAIKAFGPLLHPDEKEKFRMILESGPISLAEKKAMWRASRKEVS